MFIDNRNEIVQITKNSQNYDDLHLTNIACFSKLPLSGMNHFLQGIFPLDAEAFFQLTPPPPSLGSFPFCLAFQTLVLPRVPSPTAFLFSVCIFCLFFCNMKRWRSGTLLGSPGLSSV